MNTLGEEEGKPSVSYKRTVEILVFDPRECHSGSP